MKQKILETFSYTELNAMCLTGEVHCINGYYFTSDSAMTMEERAEILAHRIPPNALVSHATASWILCCRFQPPRTLFLTAKPGKKLKQDIEVGVKQFNNALKVSEIVTIRGIFLTSPLRTFLDRLFQVTHWNSAICSELYSLQRLAKINEYGLKFAVKNTHAYLVGAERLEQYFHQLRTLNSVNVINPVDPTYRIK